MGEGILIMAEELIVEKVTDGSKVTRRWLGLNDNEILFPVAGAVGSALIVGLSNIGVPLIFVMPMFPIPFVLSLILLFTLVYKKPPHYAADLADQTAYGSHFSPYSGKFSLAPDGMITDDVIIWGDPGNGWWSVGMEMLVPPLDYARHEQRNDFKLQLDALLNFFAKENVRIQFYWTVEGNYPELDDYNRMTETLPPDSVCYKYRKLRHAQYAEQLTSGHLRREKLLVFISKELTGKLSDNLSASAYDEAEKELLKTNKLHAVRQFRRAKSLLESIGVKSRQLNSVELCTVLRRYYNPSFNYMDIKPNFNPACSIRENCIFSDITEADGFSFCNDNQFVAVFALQAPLPPHVYQGIVRDLTKLDIHNYNITVNITPKSLHKMVHEEESAMRVIKNQIKHGEAPETLEFNYRRRREMLEEMDKGHVTPLDCQVIISVSAPEQEELQMKITAIKGALGNIPIGYYLLTEPKGAINAFFQATPGWMFGKRAGHSFRILNKFASCLIPFSSTYTGNLHNAEAIYNGADGNLIGVKQFAGAFDEDSDPQHCIVFGKTGSGKSVLTCDLMLQTQGFYKYTCIIDYGLSYQALAAVLGHKPIRLSPSSGITINYFDTNQLPLTGEHLSLVATVLRVMCNELASEGMIMRYLQAFYQTYAADWLEANMDKQKMLVAIAILQECYLADHSADDEAEAYKLAKANYEAAAFTDETCARYFLKSSGRERVYMQCFAFFQPEDFPTHTLFVNYLRAKPFPEEEDTKKLQDVADALDMWCAGGKNGRLFDGVTNLKLDSDFEYFELSGVPANDPNFKFVTGAVIQMLAMSKIERLPREDKKRLIIDEANSFFEIPQGAKVIEAAMTKYRKHRCSVLVSFQQYEMLNNKDIKESVISNIHQYILLGQSDTGDVNRLGESLGLSQAIKEAVLQFETPANLPEDNRYSGFAQITKQGGLTAGIARNYLTKEMLKIQSNKISTKQEN
jgi:type IV secretory pathway VirB4 component